ncbi:glycosyltransferase [Chlorogloeopsis sp. ULAP02]|uniref:glycosyltransferase n=1 Tax=Chlorogloeopsis sp. ULAP02 TaxID=3107926 RepID=UPI003135E3E0
MNVAPITHDVISGLTFAIPPSIGALQNLGIQTGLLSTSARGQYKKIEPYPVKHIQDLSFYPVLASMPEPLNKPDLIVFHSTYILEHVRLAYEAVQRKIPYVIKPHGGMTRGAQKLKQLKKKVGNLLFFNWMVKNAAALHCLTKHEAEDVRQMWNRPVFIVGNGVNIPPIEISTHPGIQAQLKFVFLGRLDIEHKGLDLLLEACAIIQEKLRTSQVQVHLYGSDVAGSRVKLKALIDKYKIHDFVHVQDSVWGEAKQAVFQNADLFLHTSRFEGHPMAVLEALSYGIPCLLTPGTNMTEEIAIAQAGWVVAPNPISIAEGMSTILEKLSEIPARGQSARNLIEKKYSWEQIGRYLKTEYEQIIDESRVKLVS